MTWTHGGNVRSTAHPGSRLVPGRGLLSLSAPLAFLAALGSAPCLLAAGPEGDRAVPEAASNANARPAPRGEDFAPPEEFIDAAGIQTHFVARGTQGPAIVLLHGFGSSTFTWRKTLAGELAEQFRLVAVDIKGFGLTEKPRDGRYHIRAYADHLLGFLEAMGLERPVLVGNSMGGAVALHLALTHPERVAGLVLVDSAMPDFRPPRIDRARQAPEAPEAEPSEAGSRRRLTLRPNPNLLRLLITRSMIEQGLKASYRDPSVVTPEMIDAYYVPTTIDGAMEALAAMLSTTTDAEAPAQPLPPLESLRLPTLVVWGRHDRVIPVALAEVFTRRIPEASQVIFEGSGHLPHEEEPAAFDDLLARFVLGIPSARPAHLPR